MLVVSWKVKKQERKMTDQELAALKQVQGDVLLDARIVEQLAVAIKAGDTGTTAQLLPRLVAAATATGTDLAAAAPKDGLKTSEFWLAAVVLAVIAYFQYAGKPLPVSADVALAGLAAVYGVVRGWVKKP